MAESYMAEALDDFKAKVKRPRPEYQRPLNRPFATAVVGTSHDAAPSLSWSRWASHGRSIQVMAPSTAPRSTCRYNSIQDAPSREGHSCTLPSLLVMVEVNVCHVFGQVFDALKRPHQCATVQLDFVQPERFDLKYQKGGEGERSNCETPALEPAFLDGLDTPHPSQPKPVP